MIKENLGIQVEVQDVEQSIYMEGMYNQKTNKGGDYIFAMVPYELTLLTAALAGGVGRL